MKRRRFFFSLLPVFPLLLLCQPAARAQAVAEYEPVPFRISSLDTAFAMQGDFEGEYTVYPEGISVRLTKALVRIGTHCPYKGAREFRAISFGLATLNENGRWKTANRSLKHPVARVMLPGDEYRFEGVEFFIPKRLATDLSKHWLVVQMDDWVLNHPVRAEPTEGFAFASSCRDIFIKKGNAEDCVLKERARQARRAG
ncbi:MAG TPA: hypothetical protein VD861_09270 [Pyrinomonadaceae bacterium]|nr:hypothetical protein [Pyrinomonadaceae bacterium]